MYTATSLIGEQNRTEQTQAGALVFCKSVAAVTRTLHCSVFHETLVRAATVVRSAAAATTCMYRQNLLNLLTALVAMD